MPKLDRNAAFNEAFGSDPKLDRAEAEKLAEDGGGLADAGREFVRGTYQLADSTMGMIDRGFVGDLMRAMKGKPTSRDVDPIVTNFLRLPKAEQERISSEYLNAGTPMQDAQAYFKNAADEWAKKRSPSLQAAEDYTQQGDGVVDIVTRYAEEPSALAGALIRNLPQMLPMLAVRKAPISAQANIGTFYQGGVGAQQARDQSLTDAKQSGASATDTVNAAQTAEDVGGAVSTFAGLFGARGDVAALNAITGRSLAPILAGGKKELLKQPALNAVEEFIDEAGSPLGSNIGAQKTYDPNRAVMDNVVNQGMHGALIGGPMGIAQGSSMAFGKREQTPETAAANADALVSAINNAVGPIVQTRDTLKTQVDDISNQVKAFDEASANGQLNAADIARKQALLQELAAKQTELSTVQTQAQDAAISASNDALKQYAQAGEVPDFNAMGERLGINPDDLSSLYDQHSTSIKQQQAATDTRNKVASLIEANDTEGAQAFLEQNGFKQDQADVIMGDAMKSIAAKNKEANAKKAAEAKQQAKLDAETKLRAERDSELAAILKTKPDASFANDVLPILQKKYKLQSGSEALSVWNEAKKQSKAAPVEQQAVAAEVTDEERLNAKKAIYSAYKDTGYPDDSAALSVSNVQNKANEKGVPFNVWRAEGGTLAVVPASQKSPVTNGKLIGTIHPESKATADEQTPAIDNTQAIADELAQHIETKTRPDFIGLGKKYSAKPLDLDKQYREMLRVKKEQSRTAPPVAPVQGEAAPIVQPPQPKQKAADRPIDPEKDSLLVALAKIGGLSRDEAISHGVDKAMLGHRPIFGKLLFRTDGKSFDSAAEALAQDNYPVFEDDQYNDAGLHGGSGRSHTGKALLLALTDALNGKDVGTPQYYVAKAQKAFEEEQEQARIDALFDGKGNSKADWLDDVSDAIVDELIENPSTATQEAIEVIQNDAGTETQDVTGNSQAETQPTADETSPPVGSQEATSQSESGGREGASSGQEDTGNVGNTKAPTPMSERANRHKAHIETDDGKHIYEGTTGDSSFHYLWNEDADEVSLYRVKLIKNKDTGVVEGREISIFDPSTGKQIGTINSTGNKNLTDSALIISSINIGSAVQHYAQDPATLTQSERDANVKDLTQKVLAVRIKLQEQKIAMGEEMGVSKAKREKEQAELDRLKGLLTPKAPTTNGQQIAAALDATAAAIGAVAHQTAINRFKKEGGLTYRNPAAIEQVQKDERYNVEINTDGHAVVKGIKDGDTWVGVAPEAQTERKEAQAEPAPQEEIIEHVTAKGKTIRGVVRKGITKDEAKLIDPYTFAKDGGFFLREKYLTQADPVKAEAKQELSQDKPVKNNTPTPVKQPETKPRDKSAKKLIGKNPEGKDLYEDGNGIRFYDNGNGFLVGESVAIQLGNRANPYDTSNRTNEHRTVEEVAARQPKPKKLQYGDEGYTSDMANQDLSELYLQKEKNGMVEDDRLNQRIKNLEKIFYELRANEPLGRKTNEEKPAPKQPSANTIFTEDAAAAARERLKKKLGGNRLNSGFDPEILQDGLILAGYHIEKGARSFAAFAKAIVEDMGDVVKPYIKSWYMGVKYDPRAANFDGMSGAAEVDSADIESILKVDSQQPATPTPTANGEIVDDYDENDLDAGDGTEGWKYGGYIFGDDDVSYGVGYREIRKVDSNGTQRVIRQIRIYNDNRASYMAVWENESSKITDGILDGFSIDTAKFHFSMSDATENAFSNDATDGDALWTRFGREITDSIKYEMSREPKPNKAPKDKIGLPSPKQPTDKGDSNESKGNGSNSTRPLENVLPEGNQPTGKEGNTTTGGRGIGGANTTRNGRSNAGRSNRGGGVAAGQDSMDFEQPTQLDEQELAEEAEKVEDKTLPGQPRTPKKLTGVNPGNYRITEADKIGTGTPGERLKQNLEAIRLVRKLQEEGRYATKEEQAILAKYVGWGGLANAFDEASKQKQYREANAELKRLLSPEEYTEALVSTQNAHYTSPKVIKAMYDLVRHLGFMGGNVLEPTVGSGNFIGLMPEDFAASSNWYAAEIDPITGALAQYLYPEGQVMAGKGFQDAEFAYGKFDLAIGNPPFGDTRITDTNKARKHLTRMKIHNYIISKSGMHLRPGGVMAMVITHRFLDAKDDEARAELAKNFRFVGALRLPNTAFKENANTEVTTDIVIFQRLKPGEEATTNLEWLNNSVTIKGEKGEDISINGYFAKHPEMMLGKPTLDGTMYAGARGDEFTLEAIPGMDLEQAIADRIKTNLADQAGTMDNSAEYLEAASAGNMVNRADVGIGGFLFEGGKLSMRESDDANGNPVFVVLTPSTQWTEKTELGQKRYDRIIGMLHLRQQTIEMIALEMADAPVKLLDKHRALLNKSYDAFVKEHGFLADPANSKLMDGDIGLEFGLENSYQKALSVARAKATGMKPKPASAKKSDILSRRVFTPHKVVTSADSARDGYLISLSEHGKLDIPYISELTGKTIKQVTDELSSGENPLIFMNPKTEKWEQHDEYLSGNVKVKHQEAVRAGLETNAKALEAVFPEDVKPNDLHITVRSGWLPVDHFVQFLDLLGVKNSKVSINAFTGTMFVTRGDETANALSEEFKNEDYDISEMLTNLANGRVLTAYDREPDGNGGYKRVVNKDRTAILSIQSKKMKELFNDWMRLDDGRMQEAAKAFNEKMNTHSTREYNGAKMLVTVGASPSIKLLNTQKNAAWRMIQSPVILLDHVVGAGKTFTLITGIMERRRLGLSRKPAMVVPNHLVGQWAKDFYALYPAAKLLAISEKDFAKSNRQRLFARMATGNFDCIIMGHSSLKFIQVSAATESKMINEEIAYLEKALAVASDSEDKRTVKSLANQISKKKERFKALADIKRDTLVEWEQMGIDYLGVDESHEFKNLEYSTSMQRVTGMNDPKGSQRAFDLYMKIRELRARGGGVAFATGTPISNSLVEMYTVLRYLNREELKSRGNDVFDAWVGTYGEVDSRIEYTATQKLKSRNVLARFGNLPELLQLYNEVADTVTMTNLKEIYAEQVRESNKLTGENKSEKMPIPPVKDGGRQLDVGNLTAAQSEYMDYLVARAESIEEQGGKNDPKIDNLLWISNDARKMSLDMRLVDPMAQDSPDSKVNRAANNIKRTYDRTNANKGTQLVFCDLSTPKKGADKEGKKIIKAALEKLGLDNDSRFARMMEDETLQIQWRMIMDRADNIIEDENTDDATRERIEDWLDKLDSDIEGILLTADSGFSVYDALKQTLVDKGIPENEIAFIHDYNSRDQKTELFGLVNDGSIRVLLGSSPKMGAGTNVQKRLVALHHMDAPWRPSDVEQREGRIIRQGNLFATPPSAENPNPLYNPNFEVEIKAYSTNRTFDTVMWQTLQRKAAMIEQFRSGEREMVEPNGDAAGYAEFMAQSTGNPAFKRKIEIEGELNGLQAQKRSYMARQGEARRFLEHYDQAKARALKSLEGHKDGPIDSATYNGKTYANDYEAARLAEEAIYRDEFDQWEIDDKEHGPLLLDYIKLSEEDKAKAKKPKTPKKPAYPTIASKRMQAKSEWSQMVAKMMEDAEKNGEAKAKIYGDKELKLYREESNGEKTEWYLELGNVDIAYSISKTPNVGTIETGFMPNVMVNNLFRHRKNAENRIAELEESKPIAERVLAKPFPDQEKLESMEKEYEVVKDEVDSLAWSESKRRSLQVNRYIAGDKERQLTVKGGIDLVKHGNWRVIEKTINTKGKESVTTWVVVNKGDGAYKGQPTNNFATKQEAIAWAEKEQLENDPEGKPSPTRSTINKTERMPPVKYEVTENGNTYEVRQPANPSSRMSQINLFSSPLPSPTVIDNQRQAAGNFAVNIESVEQGRIKSVPSKVTDSKGAASILREFGNRAQETLLILMLDENNKPIEVARHSIGNATSSIVDVGIAIGSIASNPNARTVYFGHNHPSGNAEPSQADKNITEKLKEFTDLIGVNFGGHVVIGENDYSLIKHKFDVTENIDYQPATNSRNSVPVTERIITARSKDKPMEASSPQAAESIVEKIDQDGLILLNSQNKVMGFIAITPQEMANLKGNPALVRKMFSDWSKAGADSTIIVTTSAQNEAADNISNALMSTGTMRVLDHFYKNSSGKYLSRRNLATFRPQEGPYFSREATKPSQLPIYRIDGQDFDAKKIKPHGLYVSIPDDSSTFESPHKEVGDTSFSGYASPKNPLNVESIKIQHKRGNNYPMETSAGVSALHQLVDKPLFDSLIKADKKELIATIKEQFPDIDTSQYHDAYELLEVLGAQLAIQDGYDAIIQKNGNDEFNEMVILDNAIIGSMSPLKSSTTEGGGLTIAQVRATLVDHFGEKTVKALEDKGLIVIYANVSAVPKQFDAKQGDQGFYDPNTGITHLIAENLNPETVLPTMLHEMSGHKGFQTMLDPKLYDALMGTFNRLVAAGNPIAIEAQRRAEEAETNKATQEMEYLPYLLTVAQQELQATNLQKSAITKLINRIISAVRAFAFEKLGVRLELTPSDMVALAERMIKALASAKATITKGSEAQVQFSQLNTPQSQINAVRRKYEGTSQWMKAPNGQPTKLNEMQWLQVRTPNFKAWFGDWENDPANASKVVDANGEPMVVYHGTGEDFTVFNEGGSFFTDDPMIADGYANGEIVYETYLKIDSPYIVSAKGRKWDSLKNKRGTSTRDIVNNSRGTNDGVIFKNINDDPSDDENGQTSNVYVTFEPTQIKSATGNTGEFNPANPDIRFSRASNGQPSPTPNPKLDRLLHGIGPGEKLFNALAQPIHKWLDTHTSSQWKLVNNMSPAFKQMMREYLRDQKASEEQTKNIVENGIAMSADERNLLSDVLEKMVASGTTIPQHIVQVAAAMRSALSGQTDELVRLGMLSEGSAERWRDTYLPRLYDKAAKDPINKALAKRLNIVGDHLKGRGIFREVEEKLEAKYEKLGWENRGKGKKGHVIMWRDYTYEERVKMGEIRDALHRFATGFLSTQRDIATGRLLEKIADNPDLASVDPVAGWTLVPTATIKETGGVKRYGKLSGMYVHPDVWENTKHYIDDRDGLMEFYRQTLSVWKQGKTALNVVAHMNNVVSNAVMVTAAGANMADVARGYDSIMKEDQYYKEAKELGMLASGHFTGDIRDYFGGDIQDATTPSNLVFKAFKAAWRNKGFEFMRKMYDAEDQLFRMALYRKARELGATQAESIDFAETFMFNYADLPAGIKKIRDFGLPFISYTYKAVPAVTRVALTHPHRVLALVGMVYAFNAIAYAMLGADADEDKERKNLPDYMQGYSAWGVPKLVRLPWNDGEKAAFLDVYRWAPLGDFFAIGNRTGGADMPTWAMMSGPYWSFYNTMIQNRNGLTGKNYLEDTDTDRQVFFKRMKFGLSEWVPMYYHLDKNLNAVRNELGDTPASKLLEGVGYTGTDMRGDPSELKNSLLGATGIKVRKLDMDDQQQRKLVALKSEMLDRVRQMRRIQRDKSNPYRERDIAAQKEEIKRLKEKAQEIRKQ